MIQKPVTSSPRTSLSLVLVVGFLYLFWPATGQSQTSDDPDATRARLERIESELAERARHSRELAQRAEAAGHEAEALTRRIIATAADVQGLEEKVTALAIKIESLVEMLNEQEDLLDQRQDQMSHTLAALQRLSRRPPHLALLRPTDANETVKGALLLRELAPQLEKDAREIGQQVERIIILRTDLENERTSLRDDHKALEASQRELESLRKAREEDRKRLLGEAEDESRVMARLANQARDLEGLLEAIEKERKRRMALAADAAKRVGNAPDRTTPPSVQPPPQSTSIGQAHGSLPLPVRGRLLKAFGSENGGLHEKGLTIATLAGAQVIAPHDGRVAFAGPFRGYGRLLIITHGEGYHTLLAGMEQIYASVGQWVLAGEPVGLMTEDNEGGSKNATQSANIITGDAPKLYVELRKGGEPIDPLPWLAAGLGKVS